MRNDGTTSINARHRAKQVCMATIDRLVRAVAELNRVANDGVEAAWRGALGGHWGDRTTRPS